MPYGPPGRVTAASRSATATPMWSIRPNTARDNTLRPVRVALIANPASGGGLDPAPLAAALRERGAEVAVHGCEPPDLQAAAAGKPDHVAVAGGGGTIGPGAELAGRVRGPPRGHPARNPQDLPRAR